MSLLKSLDLLVSKLLNLLNIEYVLAESVVADVLLHLNVGDLEVITLSYNGKILVSLLSDLLLKSGLLNCLLRLLSVLLLSLCCLNLASCGSCYCCNVCIAVSGSTIVSGVGDCGDGSVGLVSKDVSRNGLGCTSELSSGKNLVLVNECVVCLDLLGKSLLNGLNLLVLELVANVEVLSKSLDHVSLVGEAVDDEEDLVVALCTILLLLGSCESGLNVVKCLVALSEILLKLLLVKDGDVSVVCANGCGCGSAYGIDAVVVGTCKNLLRKIEGNLGCLLTGSLVVVANEIIVLLDLLLKILSNLLCALLVTTVAASCKVVAEFDKNLLLHSNALNNKFYSGLLLFTHFFLLPGVLNPLQIKFLFYYLFLNDKFRVM